MFLRLLSFRNINTSFALPSNLYGAGPCRGRPGRMLENSYMSVAPFLCDNMVDYSL